MKISFIEEDNWPVRRVLAVLSKTADDFTPRMKAIAGVLDDETEQNFDEQGRPPWTPLAKSTLKRRPDRADGMILQDTGRLKASISTSYGKDFAVIGSNSVYARIHQLGGSIKVGERTGAVRLRTDKNGELVRQRGHPNLARFAKKSHKQAILKPWASGGYEIDIPARPYLQISSEGWQEIGAIVGDVMDEAARNIRKGRK
ncbi:MAG: phage virion morphogenesis protein [Betaproteobacteria bacterium]|nr:phage virion morphogenesis protein [Betaproteobacteria bacterium]